MGHTSWYLWVSILLFVWRLGLCSLPPAARRAGSGPLASVVASLSGSVCVRVSQRAPGLLSKLALFYSRVAPDCVNTLR